MFIPIDKWALTLKNGGKWIFYCGTKAAIHSSEWAEWIGGAQSIKERRLLCESMFILVDIRILILKKVERKAFLAKPKL